jgi:hypothetical protein
MKRMRVALLVDCLAQQKAAASARSQQARRTPAPAADAKEEAPVEANAGPSGLAIARRISSKTRHASALAPAIPRRTLR